jgi:hypothetical protein
MLFYNHSLMFDPIYVRAHKNKSNRLNLELECKCADSIYTKSFELGLLSKRLTIVNMENMAQRIVSGLWLKTG